MSKKIDEAIECLGMVLGEYTATDRAHELLVEHRNESDAEGAELQRQAVALVKQYGLFLPAPAKAFFRKLADYLKWDDLKGILK
jgi:hypothetical protein